MMKETLLLQVQRLMPFMVRGVLGDSDRRSVVWNSFCILRCNTVVTLIGKLMKDKILPFCSDLIPDMMKLEENRNSIQNELISMLFIPHSFSGFMHSKRPRVRILILADRE